MKTYIQKNTIGLYAVEELGKGYLTGSTCDDYNVGAWIELNDKQIIFLKENPSATPREIIEMELIPPPPEQTLSERKEIAVNHVTNEAVRAIEELYPLSVIRDVVLGRMSENDIAQLREDYENTINAASVALSDAKELIGRATDSDATQKAIDGFRDSLRVVTADSGIVRDTIIDSLINAGRAKNAELPYEKKITE